MKLTNGEIYSTKGPFIELLKAKFPVMVAYQLAQTAKALSAQVEIIEKVREGLIAKYGAAADPEMPNMKSIQPGDKNFPEFAVEFGTLMSLEVEVEIAVVELPLKVASICGACRESTERELEIEVYILMALDKFIRIAQAPVLVK